MCSEFNTSYNSDTIAENLDLQTPKDNNKKLQMFTPSTRKEDYPITSNHIKKLFPQNLCL